LAVDWVPPQADGWPALATLHLRRRPHPPGQAERQIVLQPDELGQWRLAGPGEWDQLLAPHMVRRLLACADALRTGSTAYLHHGRHPTDPTR